MASYTDTKIKAVEEIIDKFTQNTLDTYVRMTVKNAAKSKMKEGASATDVADADAVFDCIDKNFAGDVVTAEACKQVCPRAILYVLRNEIIKTIESK